MNIVVAPALSGVADVKGSVPDVALSGAAQPASEQAAVSASAAGTLAWAPEKRAYPAPAQVPTQHGARGIQFDFNDGCRVVLPEAEHPWRVRLSDLDTGNILFETELKAGRVNSTKRYYVRVRLEVWQQGESVFVHEYSAADREVLVQFPVGTLGDTIGWFPYAVKFKESHGCWLTCGMAEKLIPLFRDAYRDITFLPHEEIKPERYYATYSMVYSSMTRISRFSRAISAMSDCTARPATSWASTRPRCHRASRFPTTAGRLPNPMSLLPRRAPRRRNIGTIRPAGTTSSASSKKPAIG